jgi:hypothetical protein
MSTGIASTRQFAAAGLALLIVSAIYAAEPVSLAKDWKFDIVHLKNGSLLKGVILEETPTSFRFQHVRRAPGRPTICMTSNLRLADVDRIDRISDEERELLKNRLKELDPNGEGERKRMEGLDLERCPWNGKAKAGWRYESDYFALMSNAPEGIVRRAAVRLEQIYTAYAHFLPPRYPGGKATTILLYSSFDDYQKMLAEHGWKLQNSAFFNPESNRIVCGSNLEKIGNELEECRLRHQQGRAELDKYEAELRELLGKRPAELTRRLEAQIFPQRRRIAEADRHNNTVFDNANKKLFAILYHEAFHAYVGNFVYPSLRSGPSAEGPPGELPRWLNEGLAQIFETAIVEAGELRVGHADKQRLPKVKGAVRNGELMPIKELLGSGPKTFLVQHSDERLTSDRAYLGSWALTAYLSFDRRLLGSANLDAFIRSVNRGCDPEEAFAKLTGQKLPQFEKEFHAWLLKMRDDGSMLEPVVVKDR